MSINPQMFFDEAQKIIERVRTEQMENIKKTAAVMADVIANDGVVQVYGPGHSKSFAIELAHRAGGMVPFNAVLLDQLALSGVISAEELKDPATERNPDNGLALLKLHDIRPQDSFIICSNSGINGSVVEIAMEAKRRGLHLTAVTSVDHSSKSQSRHPSGKRLFEVADVVIDNCVPHGDAILSSPELPVKVCGGSSVANVFIAQSLNAETLRLLLERNYEPPIYMSQNIEGADERNEALRAKYEGRVT
ncbi:MAG: SIS domain-containing protein [Firmicutes bacterium]|nr:SIS domain-containing protein [Bacillota bacterium]